MAAPRGACHLGHAQNVRAQPRAVLRSNPELPYPPRRLMDRKDLGNRVLRCASPGRRQPRR
ncbi:hypothetical protein GCM10009608_08990 [Pseudonocardia alaniniphila]